MNQVNLLPDTLKPHLGWHGARLNFLALFLIALIRLKIVNLTNISLAFPNSAKSESSYKRKDFTDFLVILILILFLLPKLLSP